MVLKIYIKMILDEKIFVKVTSKTLKYYQKLNYDVKNKNEIIQILTKDLSKGSNVEINVKCDVCYKEKKLKYVKYLKNTKNFTDFYSCCEKCAKEKKIKTNEINSGFKYPAQNPETIYKIQKTNLEKYGCVCPMNNKEIKNKIKEKNLVKYGVEYPAQNIEIYSKVKKTNLEKYGFECSLNNKIVKEKSEKTNLEKYGVNNPLKNKEIRELGKVKKKNLYGDENYNNREKCKETNLEKYGCEHPMQNIKVFKKQQKNSSYIKKYKDTNISFQGSYEKFFLEEMEKIEKLKDIKNGKVYDYTIKGKKRKYYSDFFFDNKIIEIKSSWTYNKNGKDKNLEFENKAKWKSVKDFGDEIIILFSKKEIKKFVSSYSQCH